MMMMMMMPVSCFLLHVKDIVSRSIISYRIVTRWYRALYRLHRWYWPSF